MGHHRPLLPSELRVLGCLMEKEVLTPDLYPLSLNALQAACNQRSSREPVLDLSESDILEALNSLEERGLAARARAGLSSAGSRVAKFENHARSVLALRRDDFAILCLLLLRGPQTPGELRSRADRLFSFADLDSVLASLQRLATPESSTPAETSPLRPLVVQLARAPGAREARFSHLLGDPPSPATETPAARSNPLSDLAAQLLQLESTVHHLTERIADLEHRSSRLTVSPIAGSGSSHVASEAPATPSQSSDTPSR